MIQFYSNDLIAIIDNLFIMILTKPPPALNSSSSCIINPNSAALLICRQNFLSLETQLIIIIGLYPKKLVITSL